VPKLPITIAEWPRNEREVLRVSLDRFNGRGMVDVRAWWHDDDGSWKPGRGGLTLPTKHLRMLADGLARAVVEAEEIGLVPRLSG
jgi:hypothetical protein